MWLTVPFFFAEHLQPYDYYRYTRFGLEYLFSRAQLNVTSIQGLEGYLGTLGYQLETAARHLPILPKKQGGLVSWLIAGISLFLKPLFFLCYLLFAAADTAYKLDVSYSKNYAVIATKASGPK